MNPCFACCPPFLRLGAEPDEYRRLPSPLATSTNNVTPTGRKKALLIAISKTLGDGYPDLKVAHKDVRDMREFIMGPKYGYLADDITMLMDDGVAGHKQPTRENIVSSPKYQNSRAPLTLGTAHCGHSTQVKNRTNSEEDGMDECLVPLDGEEMMIVDNELNKALVLPLPTGAKLVALLDTCHSGSLLDLKHYRCNRVVVPWIFRGKRNSEDIRNRVVRRGAQLVTLTEQRTCKTGPSHFLSLNAKITVMCESQEAPTPTFTPASDPVARRGQSMSAASRASTRVRAHATSVVPKKNLRPLSFAFLKWVLSEEDWCESPTGQFPCNGWCRRDLRDHGTVNAHGGEEDEVKADIISLASCKDSQEAWNDEQGMSMTSMLIDYLKHASNPTLMDVLVHVSHRAYSIALERHTRTRSYKQQMKKLMTHLKNKLTRLEKHSLPPAATTGTTQRRGRTTATSLLQPAVQTRRKQAVKIQQKLDEVQSQYGLARGDMDNFQNPELSSPRPLDMMRPWTM
ncbi:caspase domain-containing protein [Roridomyces roridus]|uniref:Caspase domain-containing protein n=1 Tax=Roridomyces roridus TaxID=1738132 RepID=A0AAD7B2Z2_9AGAR|nr:caspase domain-containing protein [Roridomyces roridus]